MSQHLDHYFALSASGSSVRTEILTGLTAFMAMSYISVVNPFILAETGMTVPSVMVATALCAAFSILLMGGLGIDLVAYVLVRAAIGKAHTIHPTTLLIAACFLLHFALT